MELYIGGTAQGKKVYVTQVRGIAEARIWDNFEEWFREKLQESAPKSPSPEAESMAYLEKHPDTVIICDEVGSGIVPLDSFEREYRERLGRLLCEIAAKAERVERIVCGIGQRIGRQRYDTGAASGGGCGSRGYDHGAAFALLWR